MLVLDAVDKTYPNGVHALERFSATINVGEIVAIIGGSGCGKSTLLRAVSGLDPATSGSVTLDGVTITAPHAKIGIIFQEPRLLPWLTVADNIGFGLSDVPANVRRERIAHALAKVGLADKARPVVAFWGPSRFRRWMLSPGAICRIICSTSGPRRARRWCSLPTTSTKPS